MLAAILDGHATGLGLDESSLIAAKRILHFAPERQLRDRIRTSAAEHVTADYERGDCDLQLDMCDLSVLADESFGTVIACDVLEHVSDDRRAMREILRVLKPGGVAILSVPQADPPRLTDEDPTVLEPKQRELRFGQRDHVRMYGEDFADRLKREGFDVLVVSADSFPPEICKLHVLHPPVISDYPLATNRRRLYLSFRR